MSQKSSIESDYPSGERNPSPLGRIFGPVKEAFRGKLPLMVATGLLATGLFANADTASAYTPDNVPSGTATPEQVTDEELPDEVTTKAGAFLQVHPLVPNAELDIPILPQTFKVTGEKFDNYVVKLNGESYFLPKKYVLDEAVPNVQEQEVTKTYVVVSVVEGNARSGPDTSSNIIAKVHKGDELERTGEVEIDAGGNIVWHQIKLPDGTLAWVSQVILQDEIIPEEVSQPSVEASHPVTTTETITNTPEIADSVVFTGTGGPIASESDYLEQSLEQAQLINEEVAQIRIGENNPVGLNNEGFPIAEFKDGKWENAQILATSEFSALHDIEGTRLVEELPRQTAYANPDGTFVVKELTQEDINAAKFSITNLGIFIDLPLSPNNNLIMMWEGGIELREDWVIPQIIGDHVILSLAGDYNSIHRTRDIILKDKGKFDILALHNGTIEEAVSRPGTSNIAENILQSFRDFGFLGQDEQPLLIEDQEQYNAVIKLDAQALAFCKLLEEFQKDGKVVLPSLGNERAFDCNKKIRVTIHRFPDDEEGKVGWHNDIASTLPQKPFQINENGELVIHLALPKTNSDNVSSTIGGAFGRLLFEEFKLTPDFMDGSKPMYNSLTSSTYDYVQLKTGDKVLVYPIYADLGDESTGQWTKDN